MRGEKSLHRGESSWLILGDHLALNVAGGHELEHSGNDADDYAEANEGLAVEDFAAAQQIKGTYRGHDEATRLHRAEHVVGILPESPGIEQQLPETGESDLPTR